MNRVFVDGCFISGEMKGGEELSEQLPVWTLAIREGENHIIVIKEELRR